MIRSTNDSNIDLIEVNDPNNIPQEGQQPKRKSDEVDEVYDNYIDPPIYYESNGEDLTTQDIFRDFFVLKADLKIVENPVLWMMLDDQEIMQKIIPFKAKAKDFTSRFLSVQDEEIILYLKADDYTAWCSELYTTAVVIPFERKGTRRAVYFKKNEVKLDEGNSKAEDPELHGAKGGQEEADESDDDPFEYYEISRKEADDFTSQDIFRDFFVLKADLKTVENPVLWMMLDGKITMQKFTPFRASTKDFTSPFLSVEEEEITLYEKTFEYTTWSSHLFTAVEVIPFLGEGLRSAMYFNKELHQTAGDQEEAEDLEEIVEQDDDHAAEVYDPNNIAQQEREPKRKPHEAPSEASKTKKKNTQEPVPTVDDVNINQSIYSEIGDNYDKYSDTTTLVMDETVKKSDDHAGSSRFYESSRTDGYNFTFQDIFRDFFVLKADFGTVENPVLWMMSDNKKTIQKLTPFRAKTKDFTSPFLSVEEEEIILYEKTFDCTTWSSHLFRAVEVIPFLGEGLRSAMYFKKDKVKGDKGKSRVEDVELHRTAGDQEKDEDLEEIVEQDDVHAAEVYDPNNIAQQERDPKRKPHEAPSEASKTKKRKIEEPLPTVDDVNTNRLIYSKIGDNNDVDSDTSTLVMDETIKESDDHAESSRYYQDSWNVEDDFRDFFVLKADLKTVENPVLWMMLDDQEIMQKFTPFKAKAKDFTSRFLSVQDKEIILYQKADDYTTWCSDMFISVEIIPFSGKDSRKVMYFNKNEVKLDEGKSRVEDVELHRTAGDQEKDEDLEEIVEQDDVHAAEVYDPNNIAQQERDPKRKPHEAPSEASKTKKRKTEEPLLTVDDVNINRLIYSKIGDNNDVDSDTSTLVMDETIKESDDHAESSRYYQDSWNVEDEFRDFFVLKADLKTVENPVLWMMLDDQEIMQKFTPFKAKAKDFTSRFLSVQDEEIILYQKADDYTTWCSDMFISVEIIPFSGKDSRKVMYFNKNEVKLDEGNSKVEDAELHVAKGGQEEADESDDHAGSSRYYESSRNDGDVFTTQDIFRDFFVFKADYKAEENPVLWMMLDHQKIMQMLIPFKTKTKDFISPFLSVQEEEIILYEKTNEYTTWKSHLFTTAVVLPFLGVGLRRAMYFKKDKVKLDEVEDVELHGTAGDQEKDEDLEEIVEQDNDHAPELYDPNNIAHQGLEPKRKPYEAPSEASKTQEPVPTVDVANNNQLIYSKIGDNNDMYSDITTFVMDETVKKSYDHVGSARYYEISKNDGYGLTFQDIFRDFFVLKTDFGTVENPVIWMRSDDPEIMEMLTPFRATTKNFTSPFLSIQEEEIILYKRTNVYNFWCSDLFRAVKVIPFSGKGSLKVMYFKKGEVELDEENSKVEDVELDGTKGDQEEAKEPQRIVVQADVNVPDDYGETIGD